MPKDSRAFDPEERQRTRLLKKILDSNDLPGLSPLAIRLVELATDDRTSARDLSTIIEKDPALTTRLLKLVGSAFFARPGVVTSIPHAVVLLGFKKVRIMALTLSLQDTFPIGKRKGMDYNYFWKTSLYRALIAQGFARSARLGNLDPEEAFVGGLVLEIGYLMLYSACSEETKKGFPQANVPLDEIISWEEETLGINQRKAGSLILRRWRFSDNLVESQRYFGAEALESDKPILTRLVELARRATEIVFAQTSDLYELQQLTQGVLQLEREEINSILSNTFEKVEELGEQLSIEVDSETDIMRVMEKANQTLARINVAMDTSIQGLLEHVGQYDRSFARISEEAARSRRDILQNTLDAVAHEIRNPLLAIGGFAARLARQASEEDRGRQYARIIAEESQRLEHVLNEIISYSEIYEPSFAEKDLISIIDEVLEGLEGLFRRKNIRVIRDLFQEPVRVPLDKDGINKVLLQLFKNAIDMIDHAGGTVTVSLQTLPLTGEVSVSISDNGRPVPDDILNALFDSNLSARTFGRGLRLSLARKIIEAHNGRIEMKSLEGRGNTVKFFLSTRVRS